MAALDRAPDLGHHANHDADPSQLVAFRRKENGMSLKTSPDSLLPRGLKINIHQFKAPADNSLKPSPFRSATASIWFAALRDFAIFAIFNFIASRSIRVGTQHRPCGCLPKGP